MEKKLQNTVSSEYKFLTNQPSGKDLFKNQSQEKIATVIAKKIIDDSNFKIIGIDGTWGSGKSNLIKLIETKLGDKYKLFIYDVWGHQEDEQRKAILVELTDFIKSKDNKLVSNNNDWQNKLKILLANTKETKTINQPYLSIGFIFSLLSIVYVPTVNVFKDSLRDFFKIETWYWKLFLVTFPVFIVIGIYIYNIIKNWCSKKSFWKSFRIAAEETFQVYTNKQKEETKIETISDNQPSVRDFQNWMDEIDRDLNKKIVIVFDNFDRLPKKHILTIWSSIHIFFAEKNYENIRVILPFDREHVQNAFKDLNNEPGNQSFANDYINKTFDIVFRISLPIMSDWKQFFRNQWKEAVAKFDEEELERVIQIYEFLNRRITPREIIVFINEILTIKYLDTDYKDRYIAIFILCKDHILKNPLDSIVNLKYLNGLQSLYVNDDDFSKQLTAIVYHINVDDALELIYTEQLKKALYMNDIDTFNAICLSDFINDIFYNVICELEELSNPIKTLDKISEQSLLSPYNLDQAWSTVYEKALAKHEQVKGLKVEDWQLTLLKHSNDERYLQTLFDEYYKLFENGNTVELVALIDIFFNQLGRDRIKSQLLEKVIQPKELVEVVELKGTDYTSYKLTCEEIILDTHMSKTSIEDVLKLKNTRILATDYLLEKYQKELKERFKDFVQQNNFSMANDVLLKLKETVNTNGTLKDIITDERIYTLFTNNHSSPLPLITELIAMRIAYGESFNRSYANQFNDILAKEDQELVKPVGDTILNYIEYDDLLLLAPQFTSSKLYKSAIKYLFNEDIDIHKGHNVDKVIKSYDQVLVGLGVENDILLQELDKWKIDYDKLDFKKIPDQFMNDCFIYQDYEIAKGFYSAFHNCFTKYTEEEIKAVYNNDNNPHNKYFKNLDNSSLNQASLNIFKDVFILNLKEGKVNSNTWSILEKFEANNERLSVQNLLKDVRDGIFKSDIELTSAFGLKLIRYFLKYNLLNDKEDVFRKVFKVDFLTTEDFLNQLFANSEQIKTLYQAAKDDDKSDFKNTINEKREDGNRYDELAKLLDIREPKGKGGK